VITSRRSNDGFFDSKSTWLLSTAVSKSVKYFS
jgi:hypothetical protein